jgi:hypothetical protein
VVAIGSNGALDVTPTAEGWNQLSWSYSLFDSFGGGVYVPTYSAAGAYVLAGTGGHGHPDNNGAAVFDFSTAQWKRLDNANGVLRKSGNFVYQVTDGSGAPWHEVTGSAVPLPAHPYGTLAYMPDGTKGSVIYVTRSAVASQSVDSGASHRFDLATRMWSRASSELSTRTDVEGDVVWDAARNRWWLIPMNLHNYQNLTYLDRADMKWKSTTTQSAYSSSILAGYARTVLHNGLLIRNRGVEGGLWCFDPDNPSAGWVKLNVSGMLPRSQDRWARHSNGNWYSYSGDGGNVITRIRAPQDPKTGTWVVDSIMVAGDTLPAKAGVSDPSTLAHYSRFFYVPALDTLAWIPGGNKQVYLVKPGS